MAKDFLLEIGMEEVPARFLRGAVDQLHDKIAKWFADNHIGFDTIEKYATPRRITVIAKGVAEKQADVDEQVKGPAKKIALNEAGEWSPAALGFARSQGVEPSDLFIQELAGVEYVYARKQSTGGSTAALLEEQLKGLITSMSFPKNMRWGHHEIRFVRPIRWLISMLGDVQIPLEIAGVASGNVSRGHRFLGADATIASPAEYVSKLAEQHVIVDIDARKALIVEQIEGLAAEKGWVIPINEDLLEEVLFLVETPQVLFGTFESEFLLIPQEVLITSMREHQRYFPVLDAAGKLLPHFVTVRNGNSVSLEQVAKGNEKVLRARLSDARFFYVEDQKLAIDTALAKLEKIVFHEELGTVGAKVRRIVANADRLAAALQVDAATVAHVQRTAAICKFDLVSQMVYEFPELQGVMGEDYAAKLGEQPAVARAIFEHYQPRFSGDAVPASIIGAIVSMADKIDSIVGSFALGNIPTGSQDPYALRRQAAGIVQIIAEHNLPISLNDLFAHALQTLQDVGLLKRDAATMKRDLEDFFGLRVKNMLAEQAVRYDVVDAVMVAGIANIGGVRRKAQALQAFATDAANKGIADALNRVSNLAAKATVYGFDAAAFVEPAERELGQVWAQAKLALGAAFAQDDEAGALLVLSSLEPAITAYFDSVMVMADDEALRNNRLGLLADISGGIQQFADFRKLVW
jgi:glycyl-tRNA synthetase beta chain